MTASDPDFLSQFESNVSTRVQSQQYEKRNDFWNEPICLRLMPPALTSSNSQTINIKVTWTVPRFRLTESFLQEAVKRESSATHLLSHLFDSTTQSVILPSEDMQSQCRTSVIYDVIVTIADRIQHGGVLSRTGDSYYSGDMIFHIENVPKLSVSEQYEVLIEDIHRWLINGAICGDESVESHSMKIKTLKKTVKQLEKDMNNIHAVTIYTENGKAMVGSPLREAREAKVNQLQEIMQITKQHIIDTEQALISERAKHFSACELEITQLGSCSSEATTKNTMSFVVKLVCKEKKKDYYTNLICNKTNWSSETMYATGDRPSKTKSTKSNDGELTDGETLREERCVDVDKIRVVMLPNGFGVHEVYIEGNSIASSSVSNSEYGIIRSHHRLYHGHFHDGDYREGTLHTDCGVYTGTFQSNAPYNGTMKYSDKVVVTGEYALTPEVDDSPLGSNPYRRGLLHNGNVKVQYKDGATYEGEMQHGVITGTGVYKHPNDGV